MKLFPLVLFLTAALLAQPAAAEIYKYIDENGRITYTNVPKKGAKKLDVESPSSPKARVGNVGPSSFPRVDNQTQRKRDDQRKQILHEELTTEEKSLGEAKNALKVGEAIRLGDEVRNPSKYVERVKRLKDDVVLHERNIDALKKELGDLK